MIPRAARCPALLARHRQVSLCSAGTPVCSFARYGRQDFSSSARVSRPQQSRVIFSGIQPTGVPHLGNYLGALQQWVKIQDDAPASTTLLFSVVDLHSLTSHQTPIFRHRAKRELLAALLAVGLDPERSILFNQSDVHAHAELHWILSCDASMGYLSRMTQWKSKMSNDEIASMLTPSPNPQSQQRMKLGLFSYPVLQAADILVHRATHVPVGGDQLQHIEFARYAAKQFNSAYGQNERILVPPEPITSQTKRIASLTEPEKKMSKSHEQPRSRILLNDSPEQIASKFKTALTDSTPGITYDPERRPGISNLIEILSHFDASGRTCEEIALEYRDRSLKSLKESAAAVVTDRLAPIREEFERLMSDETGRGLELVAQQGAERASASATATLQLVKAAIGL